MSKKRSSCRTSMRSSSSIGRSITSRSSRNTGWTRSPSPRRQCARPSNELLLELGRKDTEDSPRTPQPGTPILRTPPAWQSAIKLCRALAELHGRPDLANRFPRTVNRLAVPFVSEQTHRYGIMQLQRVAAGINFTNDVNFSGACGLKIRVVWKHAACIQLITAY